MFHVRTTSVIKQPATVAKIWEMQNWSKKFTPRLQLYHAGSGFLLYLTFCLGGNGLELYEWLGQDLSGLGFLVCKIGVVGPPWVHCEDLMCYYLWLMLDLSVLRQWLHYFTHAQSVSCLNGISPCSGWAEAMVQTSLRLWIQNFLFLPTKIHYSPAFEPQGLGHFSFSPGLQDR